MAGAAAMAADAVADEAAVGAAEAVAHLPGSDLGPPVNPHPIYISDICHYGEPFTTVNSNGFNLTMQAIAVATDDELSADIEGETVVLHAGTKTYYALNPVAGRIWELLQEPRSIEDIRDILIREYAISAQRCETDLLHFLESLADEDLVEIRDPSAGHE